MSVEEKAPHKDKASEVEEVVADSRGEESAELVVCTSEYIKDGLRFVPPSPLSSHSKPSSAKVLRDSCREALSGLERRPRTAADGRGLKNPSSRGSRRPETVNFPQRQASAKAIAAQELALSTIPFRDAATYRYGLLPDQFCGRCEDGDTIHPVDKVDAKLPVSLVQMRKRKALTRELREGESAQEVLPWDSTLRNVTGSILWRKGIPLF